MYFFVIASIQIIKAVTPVREGGVISGHVIEKGTEENIPYATILIVGSGEGTVSNEQGQFEFRNLQPGDYKLRVSAVGFRTQEKTLTVSPDFATVVHFQMVEENFMTDEVVVSANRNEVSRKEALPCLVPMLWEEPSTSLRKTL